MKLSKLWKIFLPLAFLLAACGPAPATAPAIDAVATIDSYAATMIAEALTAMPTPTTPPTETPAPLPTETPLALPSDTPSSQPADATATLEPSATPDLFYPATKTPTPFLGTLAPLGLDGLPLGVFLIENNTEYKNRVLVSIYGVTSPGEKPVYYAYEIGTRFLFNIPFGTYNYTVNIADKKTFTGSFRINNYDKTTMRISLTKIQILGP